MAYEYSLVKKRFNWRAFLYAPPGICTCECLKGCSEKDRKASKCTGQTATGCQCNDNGYCSCGIPLNQYGGKIWIVEEGHPRKAFMLNRRQAIYDPTLESGDELVKQASYQYLIRGVMRDEPVFGLDGMPSTSSVSSPDATAPIKVTVA